MKTGGGDGWWRRVVETGGGDGSDTGSVTKKKGKIDLMDKEESIDADMKTLL